MAARTDADSVRALIDASVDIDLEPYILMATDIVDVIVGKDASGLMTANLLKHVESLLSAHYYSHLDPQAVSTSTGDASESYPQRDWWNEAAKLDLTGTLASMGSGNKQVQVAYLGTAPRLQRKSWNRS